MKKFLGVIVHPFLDLFNFKRHPNNVLLFAIPLAVLGFALNGIVAYLRWKQTGMIAYPLTLLAAVAVLTYAIWRVRKPLTQAIKYNADKENQHD